MTPEHLRLAAGIAGVIVVATMVAPYLPALFGPILQACAAADARGASRPTAPAPSPPAPRRPDDFADDLHVVLDLAARLQAAGRLTAVAVARQLLDEMLLPPPNPPAFVPPPGSVPEVRA